MSNRSSVFAVCLIGLIVSIPLYHSKSRSLRSIPFEEASVKPNPLTIDMYGAKIVDSEKPLLVSLENNIWTVVGSSKDGGKGGVSEIKIDKITGKIVHLSHGK